MHISKLLPAICALAVCANVISTRAQDNPAQAAARAALLEKMSELDAADAHPPAIVVTPYGATTEKAATNAIQMPPPAPTLPEAQMTTPTENAAQAKAQAEAAAQKAAVLAQEKKAAQAKQQAATAKPTSPEFQPMLPPPLPISAAKQEQLQALLVKYQADQVSSAEYQTQRAAILAQP